MKESELLGALMPGHPDILPIIQNIREKYGIPEVRPEDDGIIEILLADKDIDWESVRQEIETQVRSNPDLLCIVKGDVLNLSQHAVPLRFR